MRMCLKGYVRLLWRRKGQPPASFRSPLRIVLLFLFAYSLQPTSYSLLFADTHYVDINCATPAAPYTNWATAASNIQSAIDATEPNDIILVTNGVYTSISTANKAIIIQSVNGALTTIIDGGAANRCATLGSNGGNTNTVLSGFTLRNGRASQGGGSFCGTLNNCMLIDNTGKSSGGGASQSILNSCTISGNSASPWEGRGGGAYNCTLNNCVISGNSSSMVGGGAYSGTLRNCTLYDNSAFQEGGGVYNGELSNCTLYGNRAQFIGGGVKDCRLYNCIVYYNTAPSNPNYSGGTLSYCCTSPDPGGGGNITNEPKLITATHIALDSPCVGKGNAAYMSGVDIDGDAWCAPPSIGADEPCTASITGELSVAISVVQTKVAAGFNTSFNAAILGNATRNEWSFGDGSVLTNHAYANHTWAVTGKYDVVLTVWNSDHLTGVTCTTMVSVVEQPVFYVNASNTTPAYPYTSWATSATSIQQAIDADSTAGRLVLVTNGVYDSGGLAVYGTGFNRIALTKAVIVRSVNGPKTTTIKGTGPCGNNAVRCAYVSKDSVLDGFMLTNGATRQSTSIGSEGESGGGSLCEIGGVLSNCIVSGNSASSYGGGICGGMLFDCTVSGNLSLFEGGGVAGCVMRNCVLDGNSARNNAGGSQKSTLKNSVISNNSSPYHGGGVCQSTLDNCLLNGNSASFDGGGAYYCTLNNSTLFENSSGRKGGGAHNCTVNNSTLTANSASEGGGVWGGSSNNSIIYYNKAPVGENYSGGTILRYSCTIPDPGGTGNITKEPCLISTTHIASDSPCVGKGNAAYASGVDIDGDAWHTPPVIGADESDETSATGKLSVVISAPFTSTATGFDVPFTALNQGRATRNVWSFGDGRELTNCAYASHTWMSTGTYAVILTVWNADHSSGVACTTMVNVVKQPMFYANVSNTTPMYPYTNWATAATSIQQAIDANATAGRLVLVADGVYETGGIAVHGGMLNRIALTKAVTVQSVNGPQTTVIKGKGPTGYSAVRCAYIGEDCVLDGFLLTDGATRNLGDEIKEMAGGGVWCEDGGIVSNCTLVGNSSARCGAGAYRGVLNNCTIVGNFNGNYGGGAYLGVLNNCTIASNSATVGGGTYGGTLKNCILTGNSAGQGGGVNKSVLKNCVLTGNVSRYDGGGAYDSFLNSCTITGNSAQDGGGVWGSNLKNCIVYYNVASNNPNYRYGGLAYSCTTPSAPGVGNITNAPAFKDAANGYYRVSARSPCIDAGLNEPWMFSALDMDGNSRVLNGSVDMGAYETPFTLTLRVLLQGPYSAGTHAMTSSTNCSLSSPYAADPSTVSAMSSNAVDCVLVELLNTNGATVVSISALLTTQGQLVSASGGEGITAEVSAGDYLFPAVKHRNHLAAMSALPVAFTNTVVSYDFTTGADKYYGGTNACVELEPGVWGLIAGDADGDGRITPVDREIVRRQQGMTGYLQGDLNLDGKVDGEDQ